MIKRSISTLLIQDDKEDNETIRRELYLNPGYQSDFSLSHRTNLQDGIETIAREAPDVVLLDISFPDTSGIDSLARLKSRAIDVPIIILTASDDEDMAVKLVEAGAQDYIVKGKFPGLLARTIVHSILRNELLCRVKRSERATPMHSEAELSVRDDELRAVRQSFQKKLPKLLNEIEEAYGSKDLNSLKAQAHRMVGAGLFGFMELSHLGGVLETIIVQEQTGGLGLIESLVKRIGNEVGKIGLQPKVLGEVSSGEGSGEKAEAHPSSASIIVMDDDPVNLKAVCRTLSTKGFLVAPAHSEDEALQLCNDARFALLVVSLDVSSCNGAQLVQKLRAKIQSQVPVIYMTARSFSEISGSLTLSNVEQVLTKPIQRDKLFEAIDSLVMASLAAG